MELLGIVASLPSIEIQTERYTPLHRWKKQKGNKSKQFSINSVCHPGVDGAPWASNFKPLGLTGHQFK